MVAAEQDGDPPELPLINCTQTICGVTGIVLFKPVNLNTRNEYLNIKPGHVKVKQIRAPFIPGLDIYYYTRVNQLTILHNKCSIQTGRQAGN